MKSLVMLLAIAIAAVATIAASQEASPTSPATPAASETAKSVTSSGEIVRYDAGKTIVIRQSDDRVVTYALAPTMTVSPEVQVGRRVAIFAEPAADGVVRVTRVTTIGPEATPAVPGSPPPPAAPYTRETGKTVQTRTVTVTGDVVRYEAGKSIVVRSPDGREVTYSIAPDIPAPAEVTVGRHVSIVTEPSAAGPVLVTRITTDSITPEGQAQTTTRETVLAPSAAAETKTQTTTVYGTITAYEPGRSISLLRPDQKTVTYTIDAGSALPTGIATGKTVVIRTITRPGASRPLVRKVTYATTTTKKKR
jgi:hypothetical protein